MELRTMTMMNKTARSVAVAGLLTALSLGSVPAFAQRDAPPRTPKSGDATMDHGMPNDHGGMMPRMMNGEMQQKMARMMDNCNRMMESMMPNKDGTPTTKG